jgi:hypothetical protein
MDKKKCIAPDCGVLFKPGEGYNYDRYCKPQCYRRVMARENRRKNGVTPARELRKTCLWCNEEFTPKNGKAETCRPEHGKLYAAKKRRESGPKLTERETVIGQLVAGMGCMPAAFLDVTCDFEMLWHLKWENGDGQPFEKFKTDMRWESTMALVNRAKEHVATEGQMDVRHLHYMLVSDHIVVGEKDGVPVYYANTKEDYAGLTRKIAEARWRNDIAFDDIRDDLRESVEYNSWDSPEDFMTRVVPQYQIDLWETQTEIVEIWVEKNTIVNVIKDTCAEYRVPIRPFRGQASLSYAWDCVQSVRFNDKKLHIYYIGDHDASGYGIEKSMCERLTELLLDRCLWTPQDVMTKLRWERIGFLHEDFQKHDVEALDADEKSDSSLHEWFVEMFPDHKAAEIEALTPTEVRRRVLNAINRHRDETEWRRSSLKEEAERKSLLP